MINVMNIECQQNSQEDLRLKNQTTNFNEKFVSRIGMKNTKKSKTCHAFPHP